MRGDSASEHMCSSLMPLVSRSHCGDDGTVQYGLSANDFTNVLKLAFDCRPGSIAASVSLRASRYQDMASLLRGGLSKRA